MNQVRCKFVCSMVDKQGDSNYVCMTPVVGGSDENDKFWKYTPGGELRFFSINDHGFEMGKEYYLDITPAT